MAVLAEPVSVILPNALVEQRYPGGFRELESMCPSEAFCTDGEICRIGFSEELSANDFLRGVHRAGLQVARDGHLEKVAYIKANRLPAWPHEWWLSVGAYRGVLVASLLGSNIDKLVFPPGWRLADTLESLSTQDLELHFRLVGDGEGCRVYQSLASGERITVRPMESSADGDEWEILRDA